MLNEKAADCTKRADKPLKKQFNFSSRQSSWKATRILSRRCTYIRNTCNRALTISKGFVRIVVVKPPKLPATHCMSRQQRTENELNIERGKNFALSIISHSIGASSVLPEPLVTPDATEMAARFMAYTHAHFVLPNP
uniref:Uncharacterized protein n=1 Tax=Glossina palpalis gambiensis TaxID=67801 RepID=A0A1B0BEI5_9MUSC